MFEIRRLAMVFELYLLLHSAMLLLFRHDAIMASRCLRNPLQKPIAALNCSRLYTKCDAMSFPNYEEISLCLRSVALPWCLSYFYCYTQQCYCYSVMCMHARRYETMHFYTAFQCLHKPLSLVLQDVAWQRFFFAPYHTHCHCHFYCWC